MKVLIWRVSGSLRAFLLPKVSANLAARFWSFSVLTGDLSEGVPNANPFFLQHGQSHVHATGPLYTFQAGTLSHTLLVITFLTLQLLSFRCFKAIYSPSFASLSSPFRSGFVVLVLNVLINVKSATSASATTSAITPSTTTLRADLLATASSAFVVIWWCQTVTTKERIQSKKDNLCKMLNKLWRKFYGCNLLWDRVLCTCCCTFFFCIVVNRT